MRTSKEAMMHVHNNNMVILTSAKLPDDNRGTTSADKDGYYDVCLGALNCLNSEGKYYKYDAAKFAEMLNDEKKHTFARQLQKGVLYGEADHPDVPFIIRNKQEEQEAYIRNSIVKPDRVCFHIKEITLETTSTPSKVENGEYLVKIKAKIKPMALNSGGEIAAKALKEALEDPNRNVAFSIRCLCNDIEMPNGYWYKHIYSIVTWDYVIEPGISVATTWHTAGIMKENFQVMLPVNNVLELYSKVAGSDISRESVDRSMEANTVASAALGIVYLSDTRHTKAAKKYVDIMLN